MRISLTIPWYHSVDQSCLGSKTEERKPLALTFSSKALTSLWDAWNNQYKVIKVKLSRKSSLSPFWIAGIDTDRVITDCELKFRSSFVHSLQSFPNGSHVWPLFRRWPKLIFFNSIFLLFIYISPSSLLYFNFIGKYKYLLWLISLRLWVHPSTKSVFSLNETDYFMAIMSQSLFTKF